MPILPAIASGTLTGLALIAAIGAQNAFVLRQGLRREHVVLVVGLCAASDVLLVTAGIAGIGTVVEHAPAALVALRWAGVAFLTCYGVGALLRARNPGALRPESATTPRGAVVTRTLALTWLNPHVYLDTVVLLGSVGNQQGPVDRWWFALGACAASVAWFATLGLGARAAGGWLRTPRAWQVIERVVGVTMLGLAARLALT